MEQDRKWQVLLDLLVVFCVAFPVLALTLWAHPFHRGFFEEDMSIRLPYKQQTVTEATLACVGFALIVATILIMEHLQNRKEKNPNHEYLFGFLVRGWIWDSYSTIRIFSFGAACQQLTSNMTKYLIGRLRPHFMDVCRPIYNSSAAANALGYIQEYTCADPDDPRVKDMRLSFPSAHSSFAMYTAVFFILYVQVKGKWRGTKLLRHAVQFAILLAAWYVGLTRVVENYHHWSDVTVGFIIGAIYGCLVVIYVLKPKKGLPTTCKDTVRPETSLPITVAR